MPAPTKVHTCLGHIVRPCLKNETKARARVDSTVDSLPSMGKDLDSEPSPAKQTKPNFPNPEVGGDQKIWKKPTTLEQSETVTVTRTFSHLFPSGHSAL